MNQGSDPAPTVATAGQPAPRREGRPPELDLNRLVWDPEYREAMRPWLGHAG